MGRWRVFLVVTVSLCLLLLSVAADKPPAAGELPAATTSVPRTSEAPKAAMTNSSRGNTTLTVGGTKKGNLSRLGVDSNMIQRALYVLIGITIIGVLYFLIRAVRLKKPAQRKKYGLLSNYDDSVEMDAVESDEDDTVYEARSLRR